MSSIPTSMSARFHQFLDVLKDSGAPYFDKAVSSGIATDILERKDRRYSLPIAYRFLEGIEHREGIEDLAFLGSDREAVSAIEPQFRAYFLSSCTLMVCAQRYAKLVRSYNGRQAGLRLGSDHTWFLVATTSQVAEQSWNRFSDWSNILVPIKLFREVLGVSWTPSCIAIQSNVRITEVVRRAFPNSQINVGQAISGFSIPTRMLSWRMPDSRRFSDTNRELVLDQLNLETAIKDLAKSYISNQDFGVSTAAELADLSARTLQRRLAEVGTSFRDILDEVRFERAGALLSSPGNKIIDVALEVGYEDPSHFARAFRRMTGQSPREYQRQFH